MIDHTLLAPEATAAEVVALCSEARELQVHAVCVSPTFTQLAARELAGATVGVATVVGFPSGAHTTAVKVAEAARAVADGATEIDMVVDLGAALEGAWDKLSAEIAALRAVAPRPVLLKVIIEAAAIGSERIDPACRAAERGGADYVKTSTGYHRAGGASTDAVQAMAAAVGGRLGIKAAGGIRTGQQALALISAGATRLGMSHTRDVLNEIEELAAATRGA